MRHATELSAYLREMIRSRQPFLVEDHIIQGGSGERLPNALAVLAAAEARFMFWLVKLSGCSGDEGGTDG